VPESVHVTPLFCVSFCTVAVMVCVCPVCTEALTGDTATAIATAVAVIVTCAAAVFVDCACETAVTVTTGEEGTAAGAVYIPVGSTIPCVESPPVTPFTCHVTAVLELLLTDAVNFLLVET
jgi:hypothetical protein